MLKNLYFETLRMIALGGTALFLVSGLPATAGEALTIYSDHSTLITLPKRPATVIVGNPSIADVTIDGQRLLLHGRGFGSTNVTVLDDDGRTILNHEVFVTLSDTNAASVFKSGARQSFSCAGDCQPVLTVGDSHSPYFADLAEDITTKTRIARDEKGGDAPGGLVVMPPPLSQ